MVYFLNTLLQKFVWSPKETLFCQGRTDPIIFFFWPAPVSAA